jgi:hypothetical protein
VLLCGQESHNNSPGNRLGILDLNTYLQSSLEVRQFGRGKLVWARQCNNWLTVF